MVDPENIYNLDDEHSVKTLSQKPRSQDPKYAGSPGAFTWQVGGKPKQQVGKEAEETIDIDDDAGADATVDLNALSKDELIQLLRKAKLSDTLGSAPDTSDPKSHSESSSSEGSSSDSDGSSSGTSSSGSSDESLNTTVGKSGASSG